jgi:hypothetical protein
MIPKVGKGRELVVNSRRRRGKSGTVRQVFEVGVFDKGDDQGFFAGIVYQDGSDWKAVKGHGWWFGQDMKVKDDEGCNHWNERDVAIYWLLVRTGCQVKETAP